MGLSWRNFSYTKKTFDQNELKFDPFSAEKANAVNIKIKTLTPFGIYTRKKNDAIYERC